MRDASAYLIILIAPFLFAGLAVAFVRLRAWAKRRGASARTLRWIDALTTSALAIVHALEHTVVADLKDPTKPGTWDQVAQRSVKDLAVARLRSAAAKELRQMRVGGVDTARIDAAVDTAIESSVDTLRHAKPYLDEMRADGHEDEALRVVAGASADRVRRALRRPRPTN